MNTLTFIAALVFTSAMLTACNKNEETVLQEDPVPISLTAEQAGLIKSANSFAFELFRNVLDNDQLSKNVVISPLSVSYALSIALNGAEGTTRDAMLKAMSVKGIPTAVINRSYKDLTSALLSVDLGVIMKIANSTWTENDFVVKKAFADILTQYYNSQPESFDINDPFAPAKMNSWIEKNTNGLIKNMISDLDDNTVMLLINAIYFKGKWASQFDPEKTVNEPFRTSDGSTLNVPMMKQHDNFRYFSGEGFMMAEFPYGQGNFVMDVILPDQHQNLQSFSARLNDADFTAWVSSMEEVKMDVTFPRFRYGYKLSLKDILSGMGMGIAFTDQADFSNISDVAGLLMNDVVHQGFIETNEEGTEAAAATAVVIGVTSMPLVIQFRLDRPFLYIIRESTTNSIIFMGKVENPMAV